MLARLRRKFHEVWRYPALAAGPGDWRDLMLFSLARNRLLPAALARSFTRHGVFTITPRLRAAGGEPVRIGLDDFPGIDSFDEIFIDRIYNLKAVPFRPELVVDCGAFCGFFTTLAVGYFPQARVVCFEANPENTARLQAQLALLSRPVEMHAMAVWLQDGTVRFAGSGLGGAICRDRGTSPTEHQVPCIDFPRWLEQHHPESLVWKLDIEGAEAELLPATLPHLPRKTVCFLETHWNDERCQELLAPYCGAGFSLQEVRRRPWDQGDGAYIEWSLIRT